MQKSRQTNAKALYLIKTSPYGGEQVALYVTDKFRERVYRFVVNGEEIAEKCATTEELWEYYNRCYSG